MKPLANRLLKIVFIFIPLLLPSLGFAGGPGGSLNGSAWFDPAAIHQGESAVFHWDSNAVYCFWEGEQKLPRDNVPGFTTAQTASVTCFGSGNGESIYLEAELTVLPPKVTLTQPGADLELTLGNDLNFTAGSSLSNISRVDAYYRDASEAEGTEHWLMTLNYDQTSDTYQGAHTLTGAPRTAHYWVRVIHGNNLSDDSVVRTITINSPLAKPDAPQITTTDPTQSYTVSWPGVPEGSQYFFLLENSGDNNWQTIYEGINQSHPIEQQPLGNYQYAVMACTFEPICSELSLISEISVVTPPGVLFTEPYDNMTHTLGDTIDFTVMTSGTPVTGVDIYYRGDDEPLVAENLLLSLSESPTPGTYIGAHRLIGFPKQYIFWARATYGANLNKDSQNKITTLRTELSQPGQPQISTSNPQISYTISWFDVPSEVGYYFLLEQIGNGPIQTLYQGSEQTHTINNQADGRYRYFVIACTLDIVCSETSDAVTLGVGIVIPSVSLVAPSDGDILEAGNIDLIAEVSAIANVNGLEFYYRMQSDDLGVRNPLGTQNLNVERIDPDTDRYTLTLDAPVGEFVIWAEAIYENNTLTEVSNEASVTVQAIVTEIDCDDPATECTIEPEPATVIQPDPGADTASDQVGATAAEFDVSEHGSATYSIAIQTAEGTAGVAPQIGLSYNSQSGNGMAGVGWSISGLSSITRCHQTLEQDSATAAIEFNAEDRFCLNGQRLILKDSNATYGDVDIEYRTEIESYAYIKSIGGTLGHPGYFEIKGKDGSLSYFGRNENAKQQAVINGNTFTYSWALDQLEDNMGNPIKFAYINDNASREFYISRIDYAFGANRSVAQTSHWIKFIYEARSDEIDGYVSGSLFSVKKRLKRIDSFAEGSPIRSYHLAYVDTGNSLYDPDIASQPANQLNKQSRLESLQECLSGQGDICFPATTFEWENIEYGFSNFENGWPHHKSYRYAKPADVDGDGRSELIELRYTNESADNKYHWYTAKYNGFFETIPGSGRIRAKSSSREAWHVIDYNNDGYDDLLFALQDYWWVHLSNGQRLAVSDDLDASQYVINTYVPSGSEYASAQVQDMNGDGLADLLYEENDSFKVRYLEKNANYDPNQVQSANNLPYRWGAPDISLDFSVFRSDAIDASGFLGLVDTIEVRPSLTGSKVADFNGDGRADLLLKSLVIGHPFDLTGGGETRYADIWLVYLMGADGVSLYDGEHLKPVLKDARAVRVDDINGDGLTDLLYDRTSKNSTNPLHSWAFCLNTGKAFQPCTIISRFPNSGHLELIDYNKDGSLDLLFPSSLSTKQYHARLWTGTNFGAEIPTKAKTHRQTPELDESDGTSEQNLFLDVNADGHIDHVNIFFGDDNHRQRIRLSIARNKPANYINKITNGLGAITEIDYKSLSSMYSPIYTRGFSAGEYDWGNGSPVLDFMGPIYAVSAARSSAPVAENPDAMSSIEYRYSKARMQGGGRGFLGFEAITTIDKQTGIETITKYRQDFPYIGRPLSTTVQTPDSQIISFAENTWAEKAHSYNPAIRQVYLSETVERRYSANSIANSDQVTIDGLQQTINTHNRLDEYGNIVEVRVVTQGSGLVHTKLNLNDYGNSTEYQQYGRLTCSKVIQAYVEIDNNHTFSCNNGGESTTYKVRKSIFTYYPDTLLLKSESIQPDNPTYNSVKGYAYDEFGNVTSSTVWGRDYDGSALPARTQNYDYSGDPLGRFVDKKYNALNHLTGEVEARNHFGLPTRASNINGLVSEVFYGALGREYFSRDASGAYKHTVYRLCVSGACAGAPSQAVYSMELTHAGGLQSKTYYDVLGREIRNTKIGFDGRLISSDTEYDHLNRVKRKSEPYYESNTVYWNEVEYDILGRTRVQHNADTTDTRFHYNDLTTRVTEGINDADINAGLGLSRSQSNNIMGWLSEAEDPAGGKIEYHYDAEGDLEQLISLGDLAQPEYVVTTLSYDALGRKASIDDPDQGRWSYLYNSFGEVRVQTDAKSQKIETEYDVLGRMIRRTNIKADGSTEVISNWIYNTDASERYKLGHLDSVSDNQGYYEAHNYDSLGRKIGVTKTIDGQPYESRTTYDSVGRPFQKFDATGNNNGVQYEYNAYGYMEKIKDAQHYNNESVANYYTVEALDMRGNVVSAALGNGSIITNTYTDNAGRLTGIAAGLVGRIDKIQDISVHFDALGNLRYRHNQGAGRNIQQSFCYDNRNRLTKVQENTLTADCGSNFNYQYHANGNILVKNGVADYSYGQNVGPHAVSHAHGLDYFYDENGNLESDSGGRIINYNVFNKPVSVNKGNHTIEFAYGPDRSRYKRIDKQNGLLDSTTYYLDDVEYIHDNDGHIISKRYIDGVAIVVRETNAVGEKVASNSGHRYLYKDHLGSLDVITDKQATVLHTMHFKPFGERNEIVSPHDTRTLTTRGFTEHEMLDEVGLIHMNGRTYDPMLGRFLSPDPIIQAMTNTQNLNRYSYVLNNPLSMSDPSGYSFRQYHNAIRTVAAIALAMFTGGKSLAALKAGNVALAANWAIAGGMASGAISSGTIEGAVTGAFQAVVFFSIGQHFAGQVPSTMRDVKWVAAHAIAGGVMSKLQGGKFGHGFASAGINKFVGLNGMIPDSLVGGTIASAIVGGSVSKITGGKFQNGATTAAFSFLFNQLASSASSSSKKPVTPPTSKTETITVVIEEPDPNSPTMLGRKGMSGHSGIAVAQEFYDYGPQPYEGTNITGSQGQPWWDSSGPNGNASLSDILASKGSSVSVFTLDVSADQAAKVKAYWDNLYANPGRYHFAGRQCTTTVANSLRQAGIGSFRAWKPTTLANQLRDAGWTEK